MKTIGKIKTEKSKYSWGNDIEFMLFDIKKNKIVSAIPVLKRDKHDPIDLGDGIKLYFDGVMAETSFPPYYSKEEMFKRFQTVFSRIQKYVGSNYRLVCKASHIYDNSELQDPRACEAGCSINFNAYEVGPNPKTQFKGGLRSAGFHAHVGNKHLLDFQTRIDAIKLMDIFVGCSGVLLSDDDSEAARRELYGKSSEHRPTDFGLEYRCLAPAILKSKEKTELTFDLINYTLEQIENKNGYKLLKSIDSKMIRQAIDKCDAKLATIVLKKAKLPISLMKRIHNKYSNDFYKNWDIKVQ